MPARDVIQVALTADIDWGVFEKLVIEILREDDLPQVRKLGGGSDKGLDGVQETYCEGSVSDSVAVQITSQKSQRLKVSQTLKKLEKLQSKPKKLIIVFRDECSSPSRRQIKQQGEDIGIPVDVRDQSYLVTELGRAGGTIFQRYLGEDVRAQVDQLLGRGDPLQTAPDQLKLAVLASFGAFSLSLEGRVSRGKMFDQSVLAAVASADGMTLGRISMALGEILPGYAIDEGQLTASLSSFQKSGEIILNAGLYSTSNAVLSRIALVAKQVKDGFDALVDFVADAISSESALNDAQKGYLERNCRKALGQLVRLMGPVESNETGNHESQKWMQKILSKDLPPAIGRKALVAITEFVSVAENQSLIVPLVRAYSTIAIRNLDPLGRRWQSVVLSRSKVVLDTDAALNLLIRELPFHGPLLAATKGFAAHDAIIMISQQTVSEVVLHVQNAHRTYARFGGDALSRMTESAILANVWNAFAQGFWYAKGTSASLDWDTYLEGYLDDERPEAFVRHMFESIIPEIVIGDFDGLNSDDSILLEVLTTGGLEKREHERLKSQFRRPEELRDRLAGDLKVLLKLSEYSQVKDSYGYLISQDGSFWMAQDSLEWKDRPRVAVRTRVFPELAELCCGTQVDDETMIDLMFSPVTIAVGEMMRHEVDVLAKMGVNLRKKSLLKLDWQLRNGLQDKIHAFTTSSAAGDEELARNSTLDLLEAAESGGMDLDPVVKRLASEFRSIESRGLGAEEELTSLKSQLADIMFAVAGDSNKGRTRARQAIRELGLDESESSDGKQVE